MNIPGPILLSLKLASLTTLLLFILTLPLAYWLAFNKRKFGPLVEALVSMPLVLPPTVLGFYLLIALGPRSPLGAFLDNALGLRLVFSFEGLLIASLIYSLPFMVHPLQSGFASLPAHLREASDLLGKSRLTTLFRVLLPNMKPALLSGTVLTFAHTIGEFGVVLMIGGNIPGQTRVASIAVYERVEALDYAGAHTYSAILFALCFGILLAVFLVNRGKAQGVWK